MKPPFDPKTPEATTGNPAAGAPGWINQGDLLRIEDTVHLVPGGCELVSRPPYKWEIA